MLQVPALHTPEEMQRISNLAHVMEGAIIAVAAFVMIAESRGRLRDGAGPLTWPVLLVGAGVFLLGYLIIPHHGIDLAREQWRWVFGDPQQRQHMLLSALVAAGAGAELVWRVHPGRELIWRLGWPATTALIALVFLLHTQHGTDAAVQRATMIHRALGVVLLLSAAFRAAAVLSRTPRRAARLELTAGVSLLAAAVLLIVYREPPGAYAPSGPGQHTGTHR